MNDKKWRYKMVLSSHSYTIMQLCLLSYRFPMRRIEKFNEQVEVEVGNVRPVLCSSFAALSNAELAMNRHSPQDSTEPATCRMRHLQVIHPSWLTSNNCKLYQAELVVSSNMLWLKLNQILSDAVQRALVQLCRSKCECCLPSVIGIICQI